MRHRITGEFLAQYVPVGINTREQTHLQAEQQRTRGKHLLLTAYQRRRGNRQEPRWPLVDARLVRLCQQSARVLAWVMEAPTLQIPNRADADVSPPDQFLLG